MLLPLSLTVEILCSIKAKNHNINNCIKCQFRTVLMCIITMDKYIVNAIPNLGG
jgi:hypothetical protein